MRALITGYGGFAGGHLADELLAATDWEVWGTRRPDPVAADGAGPEREPRGSGSVQVLAVDLRQAEATRRAVERVAPDRVFHLAGQAFVPAARQDPWGSFEANVRMQINLLEALAGSRARIVVVTSCEVYGAPAPETQPTDETAPLAPVNAYASSKAAQDLVALQYGCSHGLDIRRMRPFNHIGPGQDTRFVLPAFARQLAEIEAGLRPPRLAVGNLAAERDFSDVRDIVRGYRLAAELGQGGEAYNLGSGRPRPVSDIVDALLARSPVAVRVQPDPERMRQSDIPRTWCDAGKARRVLGWETRIPFEQSIDAVLAEWRTRQSTPARER